MVTVFDRKEKSDNKLDKSANPLYVVRSFGYVLILFLVARKVWRYQRGNQKP
jgi:hypothetical protein